MTPEQFIQKWRKSQLKERSASQEHFLDLCKLLGEPTPAELDPTGDFFTFERGALKTGGGNGWADVWKKSCFAWEYKGKRKNLDDAFVQLQRYAIALENPPLLIVSDMERFRIHTNWTNTVQETHEFILDDLLNAENLKLLKYAFSDPDQLKPSKTRHALTEQAAQNFADLAEMLRQQGHDPETVSRFINKMVFCMFAEDVQLLPDHIFTNMLEESLTSPKHFATNAQKLFKAMGKGKRLGFKKIDWFNGGLFEDSTTLPLDRDQIEKALDAARLDWSDIDPAIMGTMFERGLDPKKRSQLGAHYTDPEKINQIITPVIIEPLNDEWEATKEKIKKKLKTSESHKDKGQRTKAINAAAKLHSNFIERLKNFRVLDPACGSGNFLYLSLLALKDLEHRANLEAEQLGLQKGFPTIGPECLKGIEISSFAAELARVSVWVGEIQWMRRHGFDTGRNPILKPLDTIENRDALLTPDGQPATWPTADVVVGNPPFIGNKKMIRELGETYVETLRKAYAGSLTGGVDLVVYWFDKAWSLVKAEKLQRTGLVSTNSIRGGTNRNTLLQIAEHGQIIDAWADEPWINDGAAVRVSLVCFAGKEVKLSQAPRLDGQTAVKIHGDLTAALDITGAVKLDENDDSSFVGVILNGEFEVLGKEARRQLLLPNNVNGRPNTDVLRPTLNGDDFNGIRPDRWVVDFGTSISEQEAAFYEAPFKVIEKQVKPYRFRTKQNGEFEVRAKSEREIWWRHARSRPAMRKALKGLQRYIATPMVSSYRTFGFLSVGILPDQKLVIFNRDDLTFFGILHSIFHELWTKAKCSWIGAGNDITYTKQEIYSTFPFPAGLTPNIAATDYANNPHAQAIATAAKQLNQLRENWLNPPDLIRIEPEVVPGYPDRILSIDDKAAQILKKRTLTNLYNERPAWLDNAHKQLDAAGAAAYGWPADLNEEQIIEKLFELNQQRAKQQAKKS